MKSKNLLKNDCCEWKLLTVDPQVRKTWRLGVISAIYLSRDM